MALMKLWVGIGAFVLAQSGQVVVTQDGLKLSLGAAPALAGERGEGEGEGEHGERGEGEGGERGERGEGGEGGEHGEGGEGGEGGEHGEGGEGGVRGDVPSSQPPRTMPPEDGRR